MKKHTRKINHKEEGITLIALVVTIIVLLILAGVTLNLVLGQNGLIGKAQLSSNTMAEATRNESATMAEMEDAVTRLSQNGDDNTDYSELLYNYYKDMDDSQIETNDNIIDGVNAFYLTWDYIEENGNEQDLEYIEYRRGLYKILYIVNSWSGVRAVEKVDTNNVDFNTFGVHQIGRRDCLITPDDPDRLIHIRFDRTETYDACYYLKGNGDLDLERPFAEGYYSWITNSYYDMSGKKVEAEATGKIDFYDDCYYLKGNGDLDLERLFTEQARYSWITNSYYDVYGKKVNIIKVDGPDEYNGYYLKENGDLDLERTFTEGYYCSDDESYYDLTGKRVNVLPFVSGPRYYDDVYYLKNNGDLDLERPFIEGYYSNDTGSYYDTSGKKVHVRDLHPLE